MVDRRSAPLADRQVAFADRQVAAVWMVDRHWRRFFLAHRVNSCRAFSRINYRVRRTDRHSIGPQPTADQAALSERSGRELVFPVTSRGPASQDSALFSANWRPLCLVTFGPTTVHRGIGPRRYTKPPLGNR
jgi:hypothetical protein